MSVPRTLRGYASEGEKIRREAVGTMERSELLERLGEAGWKLVCDPEARVYRPERRTIRDFAQTGLRYGAGRGSQGRISCSQVTARRVLASALALLSAALSLLALALGDWLCLIPASLYTLYLIAVAARAGRREGVFAGSVAAALTLLLQASYALGVISGSLWPRSGGGGGVSVELLRPLGRAKS